MHLPFLTATWSNLVFVNYAVPAEVLAPYVPSGLELDYFEGHALVSLVALRFSKMKLGGIIPTVPVTSFEELNLRFYVQRKINGEVRRGVVFLKEIVPSQLIAGTARLLYNEPYERRYMASDCENFDPSNGGSLSYRVQTNNGLAEISASTSDTLRNLERHSVEEFILEHYWGYAKQIDGSTSEYRVQHTPWKFWKVSSIAVSADIASLYPPELSPHLRATPYSACVAQGSPVSVYTFTSIPVRVRLDKAPPMENKGWVLYDGRCGFCSWMSRSLRPLIHRAGFSLTTIQSDWAQEILPMPKEHQSDDIRLVTREGLLLSGADAYIHGLKQLWWLAPIGMVLGAPGFRWLTWRAYKIFNRNRLLVSKACRLAPEIED